MLEFGQTQLEGGLAHFHRLWLSRV